MVFDPETPLVSAADIQAAARAFQGSRALLTAVELELFRHVGAAPRSAAEIARRAGCDQRAVDRLLRVLTVMGLAHVEADGFTAAEPARRFLDPRSPEYLGGLEHLAQIWPNWSRLTDAVRTGRTEATPLEEMDEDHFRPFIQAMHHRALNQAMDVARLLDLKPVTRLLDVGGGSGVFSMAMVEDNPLMEAVVMDLPAVTPITEEYVAQAGLSDRIATRPGDFRTEELGEGFDMILLSAIAHMNDPEGNRELLAKCFRALNPGGEVVVKDFIMDENRLEPAFGATFALNMLVNTEAGDAYTESEIRGWMEAEGFLDPRRMDLPGPASLMAARKPDEE